MIGARWDDENGKWVVSIKAPSLARRGKDTAGSLAGEGDVKDDSHVVFEDTADLLFTGLGGLSRWNWPDIVGLHDFQGTLIHSARWEVGPNDERVVAVTGPSASSSKDKEEVKKRQKTWQEDVKDWGDKKVGVIGVVRTQHAPIQLPSYTVLGLDGSSNRASFTTTRRQAVQLC